MLYIFPDHTFYDFKSFFSCYTAWIETQIHTGSFGDQWNAAVLPVMHDLWIFPDSVCDEDSQTDSLKIDPAKSLNLSTFSFQNPTSAV